MKVQSNKSRCRMELGKVIRPQTSNAIRTGKKRHKIQWKERNGRENLEGKPAGTLGQLKGF